MKKSYVSALLVILMLIVAIAVIVKATPDAKETLTPSNLTEQLHNDVAATVPSVTDDGNPITITPSAPAFGVNQPDASEPVDGEGETNETVPSTPIVGEEENNNASSEPNIGEKEDCESLVPVPEIDTEKNKDHVSSTPADGEDDKNEAVSSTPVMGGGNGDVTSSEATGSTGNADVVIPPEATGDENITDMVIEFYNPDVCHIIIASEDVMLHDGTSHIIYLYIDNRYHNLIVENNEWYFSGQPQTDMDSIDTIAEVTAIDIGLWNLNEGSYYVLYNNGSWEMLTI